MDKNNIHTLRESDAQLKRERENTGNRKAWVWGKT